MLPNNKTFPLRYALNKHRGYPIITTFWIHFPSIKMKLIIFILSVFTVVFVSANEQIPLSSFVTATATLSSPGISLFYLISLCKLVITSGKSVDVPISIHNAASEDIVVFGISGRFTKTPQFKDTYATVVINSIIFNFNNSYLYKKLPYVFLPHQMERLSINFSLSWKQWNLLVFKSLFSFLIL